MMTFRAETIIEQVKIIEVEATSENDAKEAIYHNKGQQIGDTFYRNPRIEKLEPTEENHHAEGDI